MNHLLRAVSGFSYPATAWFGLVMVFGLPWSHAFFYIGLVGMLACLLVSTTRYQELLAAVQENIGLLAILLFVFIALGLLYTQAPMELAVHDVKKYRKLLLIPVFLAIYQDLKWAKRLVIAYSCGVFTLLLPTLLDGSGLAHLLSLDLSRFRNDSYTGQSLVYWRNHIVHGFHASLLFVICVLSAIRRPRWIGLFAAVALICLANIVFFIHARTALITLLAICFLMALRYISRWYLRTGLVMMLLVNSVLAYQFSDKTHSRINSIAQEAHSFIVDRNVTTSGGIRLHYWTMSLDMFTAAPVVGKGPGAFRERLDLPDNPLRGLTHKHTHNEYLTLLSQHGLFGLTLFLLLVYQIYRQAERAQDPWLMGIVRFGLVIFLLNAATDSSLHNESEGWTVVLLACLANMHAPAAHTA